MNKLAPTIVRIINTHARRRKLNVGLIFRGRRAVAEQIIASGHRLVVLSDRFHPLFRIFRRLRQEEGSAADDRVMMIEARLDSLPIALGTLDVLVLSSGLSSKMPPQNSLARLRLLLKPGGLLIWPQPIKQGVRSMVSRLSPFRRGPLGLAKREILCLLAMEAGFNEIGQTVIPKALPPLAITTGRRNSVGDFLSF